MVGQRLVQRQGESIRQVTTIQGTKSIIEFLPLLRTIGLCMNREEGEREREKRRERRRRKSFNGKKKLCVAQRQRLAKCRDNDFLLHSRSTVPGEPRRRLSATFGQVEQSHRGKGGKSGTKWRQEVDAVSGTGSRRCVRFLCVTANNKEEDKKTHRTAISLCEFKESQ